MKSVLSAVTLISGLLMFAGYVLATDTATLKEAFRIEVLGGKQGPVQFNHLKHSKEYKKTGGAAIVCKDCHHTLKTDEPAAGEKVETCGSCHVKDGETAKTFDGKTAPPMAKMKDGKAEMKSVLYHKQCLDGCHKKVKVEGKSLVACKNCHVK